MVNLSYFRNGFVDGNEKKTNIRNIFSDDVIDSILDYYNEVSMEIKTVYSGTERLSDRYEKGVKRYQIFQLYLFILNLKFRKNSFSL